LKLKEYQENENFKNLSKEAKAFFKDSKFYFIDIIKVILDKS
jgi:hypothetical protein